MGLSQLKAALVPGQVYRRADLCLLSSNIDRNLAQLIHEGLVKKLSQGLYTVPRMTSFGEAPPSEEALIQSFLKDDHFVVYGLSQFNTLGLGTTQLYNSRIVFNRKRVGEFTLGSRTYLFRRWREAPKQLTKEFLIVELLNHLGELAENQSSILEHLKEKFLSFNTRKLLYSARHYGTLSTQKKIETLSKSIKEKENPST